jgi:hypothetical protein
MPILERPGSLDRSISRVSLAVLPFYSVCNLALLPEAGILMRWEVSGPQPPRTVSTLLSLFGFPTPDMFSSLSSAPLTHIL